MLLPIIDFVALINEVYLKMGFQVWLTKEPKPARSKPVDLKPNPLYESKKCKAHID